MKRMLALLFVFTLVGCSQKEVSDLPKDVAVQSKIAEIVELKNGDSFNLEASYVGDMLAYNGSIPGPTLKVQQGSEITINFKNNTDIATSIHSHGVRLENKYDGVVDVLQEAVQPGASFTYQIKFPDAGMFWYHPHLYEAFTQHRGLYGNYWVVPKDVDFWSPVNEEMPLMLNDLLVQNGKLDNFKGKLSPYTLMGKFGNAMLVNGEDNFKRNFKKGEVARFYITNAANTRVFNLSIPGLKMKLVGGDNGKYEREEWSQGIILAPSERAIVEVFFDKVGNFSLKNVNPQREYDLATFVVSEGGIVDDFSEQFNLLRENKKVIAEVDEFRAVFDKKFDKSITFSLEMMGMGGMGGHMMPSGGMMGHGSIQEERGMMMGGDIFDDDEKIEWEDSMPMMNEMSNPDNVKWKIVDDETDNEGMDINWKFKLGDKVKIKIFNDPESEHPMQHPFHIHGQRFLVLSTNGVKNNNFVWKDTVLVPKGDTVEILVEMQNLGKWMAHCHISEHLEAGMMLNFEVL